MNNFTKGMGGMRWAVGFAVLGLSLVLGGRAEASPQYTMECTSCHTMPPTDSGTAKKDPRTGGIPGNHAGHAGSDRSTCVVCHNADVTNYSTSHRNKTIEFSDALGYTRKQAGFLNQTSVPPNPLGTCSAAACHSNGTGANRATATYRRTPSWGGAVLDKQAGGCVTCHDVAPLSGNHPTTGTKHAAYFGTGTGSCVNCHSDHYNELKPFAHATSAGKRNVEVKLPGGATFGSNQCLNLYCHSNGRGSYSPPSWGGTLDCAGCHGTATSDTLSGAHAKHVNNPSYFGTSYGCADCHADTVTNNTTIGTYGNHVNSQVNFGSTNVGTPASGTCSTSYCHSDGKGNNKTVNWTSGTTLDCKGCHGSDASPDPQFAANFGAPNYVNAGIDQAKANSHKNHVLSAASCQNCHASTTVDGLTIKAGSAHTNGSVDTVAGNNKSFTIASKSCSNVSCHNGGGLLGAVPAAKWGDSLGCVGCHGDNGTLSTNAHAKHVNATTGKGYSCDTCHSLTVSGSSTIVGRAYHGDSTAEVQGAKVSYTSGDKSCATSCHLSATPRWNDLNSGACGSCHNALSDTGLISSYGHTTHFTAGYGPKFNGAQATSCSNCHTPNTAATHADGTLDLKSGFSKSGTCKDCHNLAVEWTSSTRLSCESCHTGTLSVINGKTAPDKGQAANLGHGKAGIGQACVACHDNNSNHIGVAGGTKRLNASLVGATNQECVYCHNDSSKVTNAAKRITGGHYGFANTCAACHDPHGTTNNNMVMLNFSTAAGRNVNTAYTGTNTFVTADGKGICQVCHTTTTYFKRGVAVDANSHQQVGSNCLECHSHNPGVGQPSFQPSGACNACHGYPPMPRNPVVAYGTHGNYSSARFEDYSGGGGAHATVAHLDPSITADMGFTPCLKCHNGSDGFHTKSMPLKGHIENVTVKVDPQYRFSTDVAFMGYTEAKLVSGANKTGTCFNVSCHFTKTKQWSIEK